jgi:hypothetical protein
MYYIDLDGLKKKKSMTIAPFFSYDSEIDEVFNFVETDGYDYKQYNDKIEFMIRQDYFAYKEETNCKIIAIIQDKYIKELSLKITYKVSGVPCSKEIRIEYTNLNQKVTITLPDFTDYTY